MRIEERRTSIGNFKSSGFTLWLCIFSFSLLSYLPGSVSLAVSSMVTRHTSSADFSKGQTKDVVIGSQGDIQLGRAAEVLVKDFTGLWSINSIVASPGTIFVGTSPNGGVYKYSLGELTKVYPVKTIDEDKISSEPNDPNQVKAEQHLTNEHVFAMATDVAGRLLVGISGEKCVLCRLETGKMATVFEPNDAKYIFAIAVDNGGDIYLGTGPEGKVYQLGPMGDEPQLVYESRDKNILSLAVGEDGFIYAGSDSRGLVYKINPRTKTATVLYDSDQPEITALLFERGAGKGDLYAAATSAQITRAKANLAAQLPLAGRPETQSSKPQSGDKVQDGRRLQIANTKKTAQEKRAQIKKPVYKKSKQARASYVYKVTGDGYVTDIFSRAAVFFCMAEQEEKLLVGTGNSGQLFTVDPALEEDAIIYEDQQASQITAAAVSGEDVYLGTANPAKLIKLGKGFASEGTYTSDLIDAGQPAKWGKLQIEADIPEGCRVQMACRSGNVKDVNDPTFSGWTEPEEITGPTQLQCPPARFCQYKLVLQSHLSGQSPLVREIAVAHTIPNLAPKVESVSTERIEAAGKKGVFKISYKSTDDNKDELIYKIDFRKIEWVNVDWIEIADDIEKTSFEWDGKTVEDGRYELRVTASDERSNTTETRLTGSRISDVVVVDNTGPMIKDHQIKNLKDKPVKISFKAVDKLSAIGKVHYTVNSNDKWIGVVPDDLVYDTTTEDFTIVIDVEDLKVGENIVAVRVSDDVGNTTYKTFHVSRAGN